MTHLSLRRVGAALLAPALAAAMIAAAPSAQAAPVSPTESGRAWLAGELTDGLMHNDQYDFDDYGLTLDAYFALDGSGQQAAADSILEAMGAHVDDYTKYGTDVYAGATAKLAAAFQQGEVDSAALVAQLEDLVQDDGADAGRASDTGTDYSNTIGQSFAVRALYGADSSEAGAASDYLLNQQCGDGSFRITLGPGACTSGDSISVDATALAVLALIDADVPDSADDVDEAIGWMASRQRDNGRLSDTGSGSAYNTNSTGLAAQAFAAAGNSGAAGSAAAWVLRYQASGNEVAGEDGAIAYDGAALSAGRTDGITDESRDQWRRSGSQAIPALGALLGPAELTVVTPTYAIERGTDASIRVTGLDAGEKVRVDIESGGRSYATADVDGIARLTVETSSRSGTWDVKAYGSGEDRVGQDSVKTLAAKTLRTSVRYSSVKRGKSQWLTVTGFSVGERVRIRYQGEFIVNTIATSGTFTHVFKVGATTGTQRVDAFGDFSRRKGRAYFRVR